MLGRRCGVTHGLTLAAAVALTAGCATLHYRDIQADFERAVEADHAEQLQPVIDSTALYAAVVDNLSDQQIEALDPKLRANAYLIRSFSAWRARQLELATKSAEAGVREPGLVANSRDDVLLHLVPALVIDSEIMARWRAADRKTSQDDYPSYEMDFKTAVEKLDAAAGRIGPPTPESVVHYVTYQRWRIYQNWRGVISGIDDPQTRQTAKDNAKQGGKSLKQAAAAAKQTIPAGQALHQIMTAQGG
jgi:hypothetical protein